MSGAPIDCDAVEEAQLDVLSEEEDDPEPTELVSSEGDAGPWSQEVEVPLVPDHPYMPLLGQDVEEPPSGESVARAMRVLRSFVQPALQPLFVMPWSVTLFFAVAEPPAMLMVPTLVCEAPPIAELPLCGGGAET
eukprot:1422880-Amphidinium_carterae.2